MKFSEEETRKKKREPWNVRTKHKLKDNTKMDVFVLNGIDCLLTKPTASSSAKRKRSSGSIRQLHASRHNQY
jgi:hypothetical protein